MEPKCDQKVGIMVLWPDNSIDVGPSATDILIHLCGGWNPPTIAQLRKVLATRCGIAPPTRTESNLEFLRRLSAAGVVRNYEVDENEWC